ncbi:hypothetical protein BS47DRAFT_638030 [Hydnum rufescens UP504]|uniref:Uncharacterized protein n=1 Tax=Hydnum rufescens UP504 TaxID=1448309 RepID=A0A9P6E2M3_9AGAM|nr:hypothetical protein BS47DRAFT_638030 [Hydnum rufescens UP504]
MTSPLPVLSAASRPCRARQRQSSPGPVTLLPAAPSANVAQHRLNSPNVRQRIQGTLFKAKREETHKGKIITCEPYSPFRLPFWESWEVKSPAAHPVVSMLIGFSVIRPIARSQQIQEAANDSGSSIHYYNRSIHAVALERYV